MTQLLIKNAKLRNTNRQSDLLIDRGKFQKIGTGIKAAPDAQVIDADGNLVCPPIADPHVHLDAVLVAGLLTRKNQTGTLLEAIDIWGEWREHLTKDLLKTNARKVIDWYIANGVLRVRTHADCTDPTLLTVESLLELKEEVKDLIDLQVVAFPQNGIFTDPMNEKLLRKAIDMGVDAVGGAPHIEYTREDGVKDVELVYDLAEKYDRLVDIHIDETGDPHSRFVEVMAKESINRGMGERSAASHTTAMHNYDNDYAYKLIGNIAKAKMNMIANPFDNAVLQNRRDGYPRRRGITRVDEMSERGINVCIGHDSIMDPWYSMGKGSMLQAAFLLLHMGQLNGASQIQQLFDMITTNSAKTMCLSDYGIKEGNSADLIIYDAQTEEDVIRLQSECTHVIRKGRVICKTQPAKRDLLYSENKWVDFKL
ncbi:MAG: cytosine deaminase [Clostridiales Family XIII bacterium]|uniref:cytosine deaminase n=1 Tax=Hominibacterium faecale TaxID=2839743 RepID=UPI0022B2A4EA|nr:cytosine deaminase [Hominibacterium faecale]MCI7300752.1 cytosine deaminase [Clostridia bacterium]MDE8735019.1 cytosine deaminase [Eubacteriales bacterium DFI.9.88]MDY3011940.1 cytosine deaminase [Clostridiales Family XIII bacterium]